jgi:hypothetical protein
MASQREPSYRPKEMAFLAWPVLILLGAASIYFSHRIQGERLSEATAARRDPGVLNLLSRRPSFAFGFRNVFADAAWLEAVQVAGARRMTPGEYDRLASLIETVNNFDPKFDVPYYLGGLLLGESPAHVPAALRILERGRTELPSAWRIPFYEGYLRYFVQGDPVAGGMALEEAARVPGCPSFVPLLASRMLAEGRRPETALQILSAMLREETDPARRKALEAMFREVEAERDIQQLEGAVERFRRQTGSAPRTLSDLVAAGILPGLPEEPHGGRYFLAPDGSVRSDRLAHRLKVFRRHDDR